MVQQDVMTNGSRQKVHRHRVEIEAALTKKISYASCDDIYASLIEI